MIGKCFSIQKCRTNKSPRATQKQLIRVQLEKNEYQVAPDRREAAELVEQPPVRDSRHEEHHRTVQTGNYCTHVPAKLVNKRTTHQNVNVLHVNILYVHLLHVMHLIA